MGAVQHVAACFGCLPAARAERAGIQLLRRFPICGGDSPDLVARPDLEHPWYYRECTVHNLPVYSIKLLKCQYPSCGQFSPCKVLCAQYLMLLPVSDIMFSFPAHMLIASRGNACCFGRSPRFWLRSTGLFNWDCCEMFSKSSLSSW